MAIPFVAHDGMFEDNSGFDDSSSFHIETKYFLIQWNGENNEVSEFSLAASQIDINAKYLQLQSFHRVKNWLERRGILIRFDNTTLSLIRGMRRRKIRNNAGLIFTKWWIVARIDLLFISTIDRILFYLQLLRSCFHQRVRIFCTNLSRFERYYGRSAIGSSDVCPIRLFMQMGLWFRIRHLERHVYGKCKCYGFLYSSVLVFTLSYTVSGNSREK